MPKHFFLTYFICIYFIAISCRNEYNELNVSSDLIRTFDSLYYDTLKLKTFCFNLKLTNCSDSSKIFWIMNCSWWENWTVNNNDFMILQAPCDGNYPISENLYPGQSKYFKAYITEYPNSKFNKIDAVKFGFLYVDTSTHENQDYLKNLRKKKFQNIVWEKK